MSTGPRGDKLIQGIYTFAFSPDGTKLATTSPDRNLWKNLTICDVKTGTCLHTFTGHTDIINTMDWHGDKIISGSEAGEVILWDLRGLDLNTVDEDGDLEVSTLNMTFLKRNMEPVKRVAFSEDGSKMMSLGIADSGAGIIIVWSTTTGEEIKNIFDDEGTRMRDACFGPDGLYMAIAAEDALKIVHVGGDMVSLSPSVFEIPGDHRNVDWKKSHIATTTLHPGGVFVQVLDIVASRLERLVKRLEYSQVDWISDLELSPDGMRVAFTGSDSRLLYVQDVSTGNRAQDMIHDKGVSTVKYSPDGTLICAASGFYNHLWDDRLKRRQIIGAAIEAYVEEYEDEGEVRARRMMNPANADFIQINKARELINDLRKKLNGYFLPYEIHRYANEFRLTQGVAEELMENEQVDPIQVEYPEESARGRKSAGGEPRKRFKRRRRRLRDSIKLRF